ncbi:hypothetical protein MMC17_008821 [Xylographa soralifera]|nr:hypothetical protein [Xylographa soralifera]
MQLPTISSLILLSLTLTTRITLADYGDDYHYGLQARDLYARNAAAEVYNDIMGLALRDADSEVDGYFPNTGLYQRSEETLQECYSRCLREAQATKNIKQHNLCRHKCANAHPGQAGTMGTF